MHDRKHYPFGYQAGMECLEQIESLGPQSTLTWQWLLGSGEVVTGGIENILYSLLAVT